MVLRYWFFRFIIMGFMIIGTYVVSYRLTACSSLFLKVINNYM